LARIIDNHQFGLLTVSLVIIALADTLSDFGIANSIIQRKEISHLELTTLYWLNVGLGIVVCVAVFLLSDLIGDVLNNPDLAPLIKTLSLAFVVIPHGQQFRALMQKELEFNKIGMIETSAVLAGFTFTVVSAHFWPLAMTAILGYLVNSAVRTLLFGYFGRKIYRRVFPFSPACRFRRASHQLADTTCSVLLIPDVFTFNILHSRLEEMNGVPVVPLYDTPLSGVNRLLKRAEDIVLATLILLLISPVLCCIALAVKLSSPGPVIFRQTRYGMDGKPIKVWKFRSMKVMENDKVVTQATQNDPRVTKVGNFLRRTSLDELPQFIN
ncbi:MOP flippase family protein, partial [Escherichia sp. R-CC3]